MADCGTNDWRFYEDRQAYVSGLVDHAGEHIAVWESSENLYKRLYNHGKNMKLVSRPFAEFKNNYGAEWIKKSASVRSVNMHRLKKSKKSDFVRSIDMHRLKESNKSNMHRLEKFKKAASASVRSIIDMHRMMSMLHRTLSGN